MVVNVAGRTLNAVSERASGGRAGQPQSVNGTKVAASNGGVAFVGDSLTAAGHWELLFSNVETRNFGIDGECSEHVLTRLRPIIEFAPAKLFLMIGTNDLGLGIPEDVIVANVGKILDELKAALSDCHFHLQTVLPREAAYTAKIRSLNRRYTDLARARNVTLIDLFPIFVDEEHGNLRRELTNDSLHLLEGGYMLWRAAIARFVS
jgi:lysophospholipase L1-like esterase